MMRRKLVYFDFVTHFGGGQRTTALLCRELAKQNEVHVIDAYGVCDDYVNAMRNGGATVHIADAEAARLEIGHRGKPLKRLAALLGQIPQTLRLRRKLTVLLNELNPDVVWTNSSKALLVLGMAARKTRGAVAFYAHGWYRKIQVPWYNRLIIKRFADYVLTVSKATQDQMALWGLRPARMHVVYNTLDVAEIRANSSDALEAETPGVERGFRVLVPATLLRTKGQHTAVEAAALLKQHSDDFVVWLAGDGDDGYVGQLHSMIRENGLADHVFLLGWRRDMPGLMQHCDVVALPTHTEGMPLTIQEAMILGKAVVTTPVGGLSDLITDGETGLLVNPEDGRALGEALDTLRTDVGMRDRLAQNGQAYMDRNFSLECQVRRVEEAFDQALSAH